jgi:thiamine pyrophosphate-dependent acetolactate synthase large subunit-like protein
MKGSEAISAVMAELGDEPVVNANGFIGREAFKAKDREANFYMIGSMGLASSMGLGVALSQPEKKAVILDGDGNVLMAMGTLAMIAAAAPKNLVHVTIDNRVYESTGSQKTLSGTIELHKVAESVGYRNSSVADDLDTLKKELRQALDSDGPSFILARVEPNFDHQSGRVIHTPEEIKQRFMTAIKS